MEAFVSYAIGLVMLLLGFCGQETTSNAILSSFVTSPCSVECGILDLLARPVIVWLIGMLLTFLGGWNSISIFSATVLSISFGFLFRVKELLDKVTGSGGGGGRMSRGTESGPMFSPMTGMAMIVLGVLLSSNQDMGVEVFRALASLASGLMASGVLFILATAAKASGINVCGIQ